MLNPINGADSEKKGNLCDHLSNERTFLSWIRTSIGIMAFGFVVERFALFIKQISILLGDVHLVGSVHSGILKGYSAVLGIFLVAFGALISALAFIQYSKIEKQIESGTYASSKFLNIILILAVLLIGMFLVIYLIASL